MQTQTVLALLFLTFCFGYSCSLPSSNPFLATAKVYSPSIKDIDDVLTLRSLQVHVPSDLSNESELYIVLSGSDSLLVKTPAQLDSDDVVCAHALFKESINQTGWDEMYVGSKEKCGRLGSIYAAGWIEGYMSATITSQFHHNFVFPKINVNGNYSEKKQIYERVYNNTLDRITESKTSNDEEKRNFWSVIEIFAAQLEGLTAGGLAGNGPTKLDIGDILFVNSNGEVADMVKLLGVYVKFDDLAPQTSPSENFFLQKSQRHAKARLRHKKESIDLERKITPEEADKIWFEKIKDMHCSVLFKLLRDANGNVKDVIAAHNTWYSYFGGPKVIKRYEFMITRHVGWEPEEFKFIYTTYAGSITSQDDFHIRKNGLVIFETTMSLYNDSLYENYVDSNTYMPTFLKLAAANFVGNTAENWVNYYKYINTGSYNSQWMVLDIELLEKSVGRKSLLPKTFMVLEQIPGVQVIRDESQTLSDATYWNSFNVPLYNETYYISGNSKMYEDTKKPVYSRENHPREIFLNKYQHLVRDIATMKQVIYMNVVDPNGDPTKMENMQVSQIAPRFDLEKDPEKMAYFGTTDGKITNLQLAKNLSMEAIIGPPIPEIDGKPFSFPDDVYKDLQGIPQTWDFPWIHYNFEFDL